MRQEESRHRRKRIYDFLIGHLWTAEGRLVRENVEIITSHSAVDQAVFRSLILDLASGMSEEGCDRETICARLAEELTWEHETDLVADVRDMERILSHWSPGTGPQSALNARDYDDLRDHRFYLISNGLERHHGLRRHKVLKSQLSEALIRFLAGKCNGQVAGNDFQSLIAVNSKSFLSRTGKRLKAELEKDSRALSLPLKPDDQLSESHILITWQQQQQHTDARLSGYIINAYADLKRLVGEATPDVARAGKGNKAAGVRVRKVMQDIKMAAHRLRKLLTKAGREVSEGTTLDDRDPGDMTETG